MKTTIVINGKKVDPRKLEAIDAETVAILKALDAKRAREYYRKNKELILARQREYRKRNIENDAKTKKAYYEKHKEEILARQKARRIG